MKTLTEMKARLVEIESELRSFKQRLEDESRNPTEEEKEEIRKRLTEADELEELVELEKRRLDLEGKFAQADDEKKQRAMKPVPDNQSRSLDYGNKKPFANLSEQLQAVMKAGMGQRVDPRLYEIRATGLGEQVGADGGFLLQEDFSTSLLQDAMATGRLASMCREVTISSNANSMKLPGIDETSRASTRWGGLLGYWLDEAAEKTASKPKFRRIELNLNKLVVLVYATDELLSDATVLEQVIRQGAAQEIGFQLDDAIINGSGVGRPLGILNAGCLVSQAIEAGQAADTVVFENIVKMWSRIFAGSQPNSVWLINQNVFPQLATMSLSVGTGGAPVWLPAGGASGSPYSSLMGRPVMPIEHCASIGDLGDIIPAVFGGGYILATKGGVQSDMSIHVRFVYDESVFRFVVRVDGQPVRASALTPYKGGSSWTQSHFVALAAR